MRDMSHVDITKPPLPLFSTPFTQNFIDRTMTFLSYTFQNDPFLVQGRIHTDN